MQEERDRKITVIVNIVRVCTILYPVNLKMYENELQTKVDDIINL